ncbi:helix-turn-helix domain-containing protein [Streptomyces sp. NPDC054845]
MIAELVAEVGPLWHERHQARLGSRPRKRAVGAGAQHRLVFIDRLLATLVHLRHGATHDVLAYWFGVGSCAWQRHSRPRWPSPSPPSRGGPCGRTESRSTRIRENPAASVTTPSTWTW